MPFGIKYSLFFEYLPPDDPLYRYCDSNPTAEACQDDHNLFGGTHTDENGFDRIYKVYCIDIDGVNQGEDPFGYGIRADGKILNGTKADEWLDKANQENS